MTEFGWRVAANWQLTLDRQQISTSLGRNGNCPGTATEKNASGDSGRVKPERPSEERMCLQLLL